MRNLILTLTLLIGFFGYAQKPKVDAVRYKEVTTTERDALTVPSGEYWNIYNVTTTQFEYWDGDSWEVIGSTALPNREMAYGNATSDGITSHTNIQAYGSLGWIKLNDGGSNTSNLYSDRLNTSYVNDKSELYYDKLRYYNTTDGSIYIKPSAGYTDGVALFYPPLTANDTIATLSDVSANAGIWGGITGTIGNQTDLITLLDDYGVKGSINTWTERQDFGGGADLQSQKITGLLAGTLATDAVNKAQLDAVGSGHAIQDAGTPVTVRPNLNFNGSGVTVSDNAGNSSTDITINGGSVEGISTTGTLLGGDYIATIGDPDSDANIVINQATETITITTGSPVVLANGANLNGNDLINLVDPTNPQDAATKAYVDGSYVDLTSAQTISGAKTFSSNVVIDGGELKVINPTTPTNTLEVEHNSSYVDLSFNDGTNAPTVLRFTENASTLSALNLLRLPDGAGDETIATEEWVVANSGGSATFWNDLTTNVTIADTLTLDNGYINYYEAVNDSITVTIPDDTTLGLSATDNYTYSFLRQGSGKVKIDYGTGVTGELVQHIADSTKKVFSLIHKGVDNWIALGDFEYYTVSTPTTNYYDLANAANFDTEVNASTGFTAVGYMTVASVADTDGASAYSIEAARTTGTGGAINVQTSISGLTNGATYTVTIRAKKDITSGDDPYYAILNATGSGFPSITTTSYAEYVSTVTMTDTTMTILFYLDSDVAGNKVQISSIKVED